MIIAVGVYCLKNCCRYTVVKDNQDNGLGRTYGHKIENYRFQDGIRITIWERLGINKIIGHTLWRIWSEELSYKNWLSESYFDEILLELME